MQRILSFLFIGYFICLYFANAGVEGFTIVLSLMALFFARQYQLKKLPKELVVASILLLVFGVISYFINTQFMSFGNNLLKFRWLLMVPLIASVCAPQSKKYISYFYKVTLVCLPLVAILCLYQFFLGKDPFRTDMQNIAPYGNFYRAVGMAGSLTTSYLVGMSVVFLAACYFLKEPLTISEKGSILTAIISGVIIIFATISRGPLLIVIAALGLGFLFVNVKKKKQIFVYFGALTAALVALIFSVPIFYKKFYDLVHLNDVSVVWRFKVWAVNLILFKEHPILGVGFCNPEYYLKEYYDKLGWSDLHFYRATGNIYTEFLAGLGFLGFAAFYYICFLFLKYNYKVFKQSKDGDTRTFAFGLFVGQIYFHLSGLIEGIFFAVQPRMMILAIWMMVLAQKQSMDQVHQERL